jgi:hypothetical protein
MEPQSEKQEKKPQTFLGKINTLYLQFERPIASFSLVGGFIFDALTLQRVDAFWENTFVLIRLFIVGFCIIMINRKATKLLEGEDIVKKHIWLLIIMQFMFGGLLSTFLIFYFRSGSIFVSWPFLLLLVVAFAANEWLRDRYARVSFQITFLYLCVFSFSIFSLPVIVNSIDPLIFLLSGLVSVVFIYLYLLLLKYFAKKAFVESKNILLVSLSGLFITINALYFFNIIPPIPLSIKDGQIYHSVEKMADGNYVVTQEKEQWTDFFKLYQEFRAVPGQPLYAYSAIYSPTKLNARVVHEWQFYDEVKKGWITNTRIPLSVFGGRGGGYRTYSQKNNYTLGKWRVNVQTDRGQTIGRIYFKVILAAEKPALETEIKN